MVDLPVAPGWFTSGPFGNRPVCASFGQKLPDRGLLGKRGTACWPCVTCRTLPPSPCRYDPARFERGANWQPL